MSEFTDLLKEAFFADEGFDAQPGRQHLLDAVQGYDRRMRLVRWMVWFSVTFFTALMVFAVVQLWGDLAAAPTRRDLVMLALAVFGMSGVGFSKYWFQDMLNHNKVMKEIKRTQLMLVEGDE